VYLSFLIPFKFYVTSNIVLAIRLGQHQSASDDERSGGLLCAFSLIEATYELYHTFAETLCLPLLSYQQKHYVARLLNYRYRGETRLRTFHKLQRKRSLRANNSLIVFDYILQLLYPSSPHWCIIPSFLLERPHPQKQSSKSVCSWQRNQSKTQDTNIQTPKYKND
jgi:hypothetical protein